MTFPAGTQITKKTTYKMNAVASNLESELKARLKAIDDASQNRYPFFTESQQAGFANLGMWAAWHSGYTKNTPPEILEVSGIFGEIFESEEKRTKLIKLGQAISENRPRYESLFDQTEA